ncbi:MAG: glycosyltransferase family 39 protein [Gemmatimonadota bacterium]
MNLERIALGLIALWIPLQLWYAWPALFATPFDGPWRYDPSIFAYEGLLLRSGAMPYVDFWDHKGPLIYLIDAAGLMLSGGQLWGIWTVGLVAIWSACAAVYAALRATFGVPAALAGVVFLLLALAGIDTSANMTEQYALPLACASALVLVRWTRSRASLIAGLALGVLGALGFFLRANLAGAPASAALTVVVVLLGAGDMRGARHHASGLVIGALTVCLPLLAWLADGGALQAFWQQAIVYNLQYSQATWSQRATTGIVGLWMASATAPLVLPLGGLIVAVRRLLRERLESAQQTVLFFAVVWLGAELILASVSGRPYDHYFMMLLPPLATLTGVLVTAGLPTLLPSLWRRVPYPAVSAALLVLVLLRPLIDRFVERARAPGLLPDAATSQVMLTADFVRANSAPDDRLLVWGLAGGVYFLSDRPPASRYLFAFPLLTPGYGDSVAPRFLADLRRSAPHLIVDATVSDPSAPSLDAWNGAWRFPQSRWYAPFRTMTPALQPFYAFVAENYSVIGVVGPERWTVYRANTGTVGTVR